jgi:hypothetical protein
LDIRVWPLKSADLNQKIYSGQIEGKESINQQENLFLDANSLIKILTTLKNKNHFVKCRFEV